MIKYYLGEVMHRILDVIQSPARVKRRHAFHFFNGKHEKEGTLRHDHYERFHTTHFGLDHAFYAGKKLLDIGCGPRGSLEWADMASQRVGLDPIVDSYRKLGIDQHAMEYVHAPAEKIPFDDGHFDVVMSFNSLDHVDDLDQAIKEIARVVAPGGLFLLITDVDHKATITEPLEFSFDVLDKFLPFFEAIEVKHFEERNRLGIYQSLAEEIVYDHDDKTEREGILTAKLQRVV